MQLYEYILECEKDRYHYYYSWEEKPDAVVSYFIRSLRDQGLPIVDIVDLFPEPKIRKVKLLEPLHINTKCGRGMYLPADFNVEIHTVYRILFEYIVDE
tara:strand:+ start:438 stop:734 length:297 start_codon:yes stop_codon:yes gene_type:complete